MGWDELSDQDKEWYGKLAFAQAEKNPKKFKRNVKETFPELSVPDVEMEDQLKEELAKRDQKIKELEEKHETKERERLILEKRKELLTEGRTKEEIEAIEKLIHEEKRVKNYDDAIALYDKYNKPVDDTPSYVPVKYDLGIKTDDFKQISDDPHWGAKEAANALNDIRSGKVRFAK